MNTAAQYRYQPDKSSKKITCPSCGQRRAVRYIDTDTNEPLPDTVSRCDRESSCGYHYTPKEYFNDNGEGYRPAVDKIVEPIKEEVIDYMPHLYIEKSMNGYESTDFAKWLIVLFSFPAACATLAKYFVGRSNKGTGKACIFWRIDSEAKVRTGKIMEYNPLTGKRQKEIYPTWVHSDKSLQPFNYKLCFFGEHLITENPTKTIGIVESEKTAIIASLFMPDMVWIATGGSSGCKWREYSVFKVLKDRNVILFPDFGIYNVKQQTTCFTEWSNRAAAIRERMNCNIKVSRLLEDKLTEDQRDGQDIADFLIKQENGKGLAMVEPGYPAIFDLYRLNN